MQQAAPAGQPASLHAEGALCTMQSANMPAACKELCIAPCSSPIAGLSFLAPLSPALPPCPAPPCPPACLQRHMVDTNQCKMAFDGCEEEYEDFYDYGEDEEGDEAMDQGE